MSKIKQLKVQLNRDGSLESTHFVNVYKNDQKEYDYFFPNSKDIKYDIMANDMFFYLPEDGLVKVDRMAMANSIEVRNPFLDHNLMDALVFSKLFLDFLDLPYSLPTFLLLS